MQPADRATPELQELVLRKLTRVFEEARAEEVLALALKELSMPTIDTPADLARMVDWLKARGGFELTVGMILGVELVLRRSAALTTAIASTTGRATGAKN